MSNERYPWVPIRAKLDSKERPETTSVKGILQPNKGLSTSRSGKALAMLSGYPSPLAKHVEVWRACFVRRFFSDYVCGPQVLISRTFLAKSGEAKSWLDSVI